jgi:hypothetical protein
MQNSWKSTALSIKFTAITLTSMLNEAQAGVSRYHHRQYSRHHYIREGYNPGLARLSAGREFLARERAWTCVYGTPFDWSLNAIGRRGRCNLWGDGCQL